MARKRGARRFASRVEREIYELIEREGYIIVDIEKEAGIERTFFSRLRKGRALLTTNAEAILNSLGYQLAIVKMPENEKEQKDE